MYRSVFRAALFAGQVVVVTGSGSGIGRCVAHELASLGATVALVGRNQDKLAAVQAELQQAGVSEDRVSRHRADIRDEAAVKALVAEVLARHGRIDALVNNAGGQYIAPLASIGAKGWQAVLDTKPGMQFPQEVPGEVPAEKQNDAVRFDHVGLTYQGAGAPSLSDISFTAKRGQTIGVIGGTGSGKSSLISLIPRFYDATEGSVEIMGRPVRQYPRADLRGKVAVVMQKAQLFGGTIRSNLLWGSQNASDADLWAALETAQAAEFVKAKPLGLDEPVEQGGRNLSGGQKQRLTIARALVGKPDILILDDSASALDYATDAALRKALAALPGDLTVFIVSQRAASLQHADQIIVLDDGRMVGLGRHAELLESCPVYKEIYESQFKKGDAQK